jgi:hypothetical protein
MGVRQFLKDFGEAVEGSSSRLRSANETQERVIARLRELQAEDAALTPEEESARRKEIDALWLQLRREKQAAREPIDDLQARYPGLIK